MCASLGSRVTRSCDLSQNLRYLTPVCDCSWPATRRSKTCDFWLQNSATLRFLNFIEAIFAIFLFFDQKVMTSVKEHKKIIWKPACWCTCSTKNLNVNFPPPSFLISTQKDMHFYPPHPPLTHPPPQKSERLHSQICGFLDNFEKFLKIAIIFLQNLAVMSKKSVIFNKKPAIFGKTPAIFQKCPLKFATKPAIFGWKSAIFQEKNLVTLIQEVSITYEKTLRIEL